MTTISLYHLWPLLIGLKMYRNQLDVDCSSNLTQSMFIACVRVCMRVRAFNQSFFTKSWLIVSWQTFLGLPFSLFAHSHRHRLHLQFSLDPFQILVFMYISFRFYELIVF